MFGPVKTRSGRAVLSSSVSIASQVVRRAKAKLPQRNIGNGRFESESERDLVVTVKRVLLPGAMCGPL
jgi:hypothetical protein